MHAGEEVDKKSRELQNRIQQVSTTVNAEIEGRKALRGAVYELGQYLAKLGFI